MTVEITLTLADADATIFDLYSNVDSFTTPFETNIPVASLTAGYITALVPDGTTSIRVKNVGDSCANYIDIILTTTTTTTSSTTTTTTTAIPSIACEETTSSGGVGVTEYLIDLEEEGGILILDFEAFSVPDKLEIIHNGVKKATSGMTVANSGPFDNLYGDPTVPNSSQAASVDQFIGTAKGSVPSRNAAFAIATGLTSVTANRQQLVWWEYTNADWNVNTSVIVRVTGATGTAWNLDRVCVPEVSLTDVLFNSSDNPTEIWQFNPVTLDETLLFTGAFVSSDIAHTENKLWIYNDTAVELTEYNITLIPFTYIINRTITNVSVDAGLCAIDDTTLINIDGLDVYTIDITASVASPSLAFTMSTAGRSVAGDYVYTTGGKLIVTTSDGANKYISQFDFSTGTLEFDLDITSTVPNPFGLYQYNSEIFIADSSGAIYNILTTSPYTLTLVHTTAFGINGASQIPSQVTEEFESNITTTTTSTTLP